MSARTVGAAAILAIALTAVPTDEVAVLPVVDIGPESVLCEGANAGTVYPDTLANRMIAAHFCVTRHATGAVHRLTHGFAVDDS